jgi:hypothetical protein
MNGFAVMGGLSVVGSPAHRISECLDPWIQEGLEHATATRL